MGVFEEKARRLESEGVFLGGPPKLFETAGRRTLIALLHEGLTPRSKVLDVGCGCLRGGYWLIHFLSRGHYLGIEPNADMLEAGLRIVLEDDERAAKAPRFDHNAEFDFSVFGETFDFLVARSIWTHASRDQIERMLDQFVLTASGSAVFLTSFIDTRRFEKGYMGDAWVGKSHESDEPGLVRHSFRWIQEACRQRDLVAEQRRDADHNFGGQTWIAVTHASL